MKRIIDRDDNGIEALRRQHRVPGVSIALICNGRLDWSGGYGELEAGSGRKVTANSLFHACSMSKMVTAVGVLRLVQAGVLELDAEANRYLRTWRLPDSPYTSDVNVTLRHLFAHQSGIADLPGSFGIYRTTDPLPTVKEILAGSTPYHSDRTSPTCAGEPIHLFGCRLLSHCTVDRGCDGGVVRRCDGAARHGAVRVEANVLLELLCFENWTRGRNQGESKRLGRTSPRRSCR
ncbi:hypothetical protein J6TS7_27590 [Paenibacillus dendritiformis]|nr:hypothetical protein J6TS7_27590 [Paenibacillus dendritiformis]